MSVPLDSESSQSSSGYEDGLGRRALAFDRETGGMLERLVLRPELSAFEDALKERIAIVAGLEDERFARPRGVARDADGRLTVVSEYLAGRRLSDIIDAAAEHGIVAGLDAGIGLLLELLPAVARLHDAGLAHGALAPGRAMITPAGQIVLLDSIYAEPLERLKLTRKRLWAECRLAFPPTAGLPRFDKAADLGHASMVAATLIVGRALQDNDYPEGISILRQEILEIASIRGSKAFADAVDRFFASTLPIAGRRSTPSADEAAIDLRKLVRKELGIDTCRTSLIEFFQQVESADAERLAAQATGREQGAHAEPERLTPGHTEAAPLEAERAAAEAGRIEGERAEKARLESERVSRGQSEKARVDKDRAEQARRENEQAEKARLEAEQLAREQAETKRLEHERAEQARRANEQAEKARLEAERIAREQAEKQRLENERAEKARLENERAEQARLEAERLERERLEAARLETERIAREKAEKARLEAERLAREKAEKARLEAERAEKARLEAERIERERAEQARIEAERLERERLEAERAAETARLEAERLEAARAEKARLEAERRERERLEAERIEKERVEKARLEAERRQRERLEAERLEKERAEKARLEAERIERERQEKARVEAERRERERLEAARLEEERAEKARLENDRLERERAEAARLAEEARLKAERLERERLEAQREAEKARLESERLAQQRAEAERRERDRVEADRRERERLEQERLEADRAAAERAERERLDAARIERERAAAAAARAADPDAEPAPPPPDDPPAPFERPRPFAAAPAPPPPAAPATNWLVSPDRAASFEPAVQDAPPPASTARAYPIYVPPAEPAAWTPDVPPPTIAPVEVGPVAAKPPALAPSAAAPAPPGTGIRLQLKETLGDGAARAESRSEPETMSAAEAYQPFTNSNERQPIPWKLIAAGVVLIAGALAISRGYTPSTDPVVSTVRKALPSPTPRPAAPPPVAGNAGRVTISTQPGGAKILLDGKPVGESPLTLDSVTPGRHVITITGAGGTARRNIRVEAGKTIALDVPLFSGFAAIAAPFVVEVSEDGKALGTNETPILLSPGRHELRVANKDLGYVATETVDVQAGEVTRLTLDPRGTANINAAPWAEVWIDGEKAGETPMANVSIQLGIRDIVFKNPQYPDRKVTVTIKANSTATVAVDFLK